MADQASRGAVLDVLYKMAVPDRQWVADLLGMPADEGFVNVAQHPVSAEAAVEECNMTATLRAVADVGLPALIIWPNSDPGHTGILSAVKAYCGGAGRTPGVKVVRSMPHEDFLRALLAASAIVGNSSAGIIEAPAEVLRLSISDPARQAGSASLAVIDCWQNRRRSPNRFIGPYASRRGLAMADVPYMVTATRPCGSPGGLSLSAATKRPFTSKTET